MVRGRAVGRTHRIVSGARTVNPPAIAIAGTIVARSVNTVYTPPISRVRRTRELPGRCAAWSRPKAAICQNGASSATVVAHRGSPADRRPAGPDAAREARRDPRRTRRSPGGRSCTSPVARRVRRRRVSAGQVEARPSDRAKRAARGWSEDPGRAAPGRAAPGPRQPVRSNGRERSSRRQVERAQRHGTRRSAGTAERLPV